ncbi:MAG TPA: hypothetical protein VMF32_23430 [Xanthobacteraceae bacterium]|nr:hypothetical protein [Xanthobacteraceae bacterium]
MTNILLRLAIGRSDHLVAPLGIFVDDAKLGEGFSFGKFHAVAL